MISVPVLYSNSFRARLIVTFTCLLLVKLAFAQSMVVTTLVDEDDGNMNPLSGNGAGISLREAINYSTPGSVITFGSSLDGGRILLQHGPLRIEKNLIIDASSNISGITIDANGDGVQQRAFLVIARKFTMKAITVTGGVAIKSPDDWGFGGAILLSAYSQMNLIACQFIHNRAEYGGAIATIEEFAELNISECLFQGNVAKESGGAIFNWSPYGIEHSIFSENRAKVGGAIYNDMQSAFQTAFIFNTTISHNAAQEGGGIYHVGSFDGEDSGAPPLVISNSTLFGNRAERQGGAIDLHGSLHLFHATIVGNTADVGGGLDLSGRFVSISNSIIADNTATTKAEDIHVLPSRLRLHGSNIFSEWTHPEFVGDDQLRVTSPMLAPFGWYGGAAMTMPPLPGSPALGAAGEGAFGTVSEADQLGRSRLVGDGPDIGAVEAVPFSTLNLTSTDGDLIPDILEGGKTPYAHLNPFLDDSAVDTDQDGSSDQNEIGNMTDLFDASDHLRITTFTTHQNEVTRDIEFRVAFPSFPGLDYAIEQDQSPDFENPTVIFLGSATGNQIVVYIPIDQRHHFFRVIRY